MILRLSGRFGLRNLGKGVSLDDLKKILELTPEPGEEPVVKNITWTLREVAPILSHSALRRMGDDALGPLQS